MASYIVSIFLLGAVFFLRDTGDLEYVWQFSGGRIALLCAIAVIYAAVYLYIRGIKKRHDS